MDLSSESSADSVVDISSDDEASDGWNSEWSTNTEELIKRVETQVTACPIPIAGRRMATASDEPGPSTTWLMKNRTGKKEPNCVKQLCLFWNRLCHPRT